MNKYFFSRRNQKKSSDEEFSETGQPWDKMADESDQAFEAFRVYRELGFSRDLPKVAMRLYQESWESNMHFVENWELQFDWDRRAALWDAHWDSHHDKIKDKARKDAEMRYIESLASIQDVQIDIALGKKKGDRTQGVMITRIIDQVVPKPQQKPQEVNVWQNVALMAPELPAEVKKGLLDTTSDADFKEIEEEAKKLIPDKLRAKRKNA